MTETRRDFFKHFTPRKTEAGAGSSIENKMENPLEKMASRRDFLKVLSIITAAVASGKDIEAEEKNSKFQNDKNRSQSTPQIQPTQTLGSKQEKEFSYDDTFMEQSLMIAAKKIVSAIFKNLGIEHGNKSIDPEELLQKLKEKPIEKYLEMAVAYPVIEELIFRGLPSGIISKSENKQAWDVGIITSAIFAALHNIKDGKNSSDFEFVTNSIPVTQFMGGLFYWYLIRERGISHSILSHSMNNTVSFAELLLKSYPNKEKSGPIFEGKTKKG